jgi:hypothetical protein
MPNHPTPPSSVVTTSVVSSQSQRLKSLLQGMAVIAALAGLLVVWQTGGLVPGQADAEGIAAPLAQATPATLTPTATSTNGSPSATAATSTVTRTATPTLTSTPTGPTPTPTPCGPYASRVCVYMPHVDRVPPDFPETPTLLNTTPSSGQTTFLWVSARATGYILYRSTQLNTVDGVVTLRDPMVIYRGAANQHSVSLTAGTYYFQVHAANAWGVSVSNIVTVAIEGVNTEGLLWADNRRGNWDIFKRQGDQFINLTFDSDFDEIDPAWSKDGQSIAYATNRDGHFEIYRMASTGAAASRVRLTQTGASVTNVQPAWSPNGQSIAFTSDAGTFNTLDIYVIPAFPSAPVSVTDDQRLTWPNAPVQPSPTPTQATPTPTPTSTPYIAPTATPVATTTYYDNHFRQTTSRQPTYSPDGGYIAFVSNRSGKDEIYTMLASGHFQQRLTYSTGTNIRPRWASNGERIAFASSRDGNWEIYSIRTDGTRELRLTTNLSTDSQPTWSTNSRFLMFITTRNGRNDIYAMAADGSEAQPVLTDGFQHYSPVWSP